MATNKFLTDTDELATVTQSALWLHVVDTTNTGSNAAGESNKLSYANIIASSADVDTGTNDLNFITPLAITTFIPDKLAVEIIPANSSADLLTIDTGLVIGWNTTNDQPTITNTTGGNVTLTYDVTYVIAGAKGSVQGTILTLATATTAYFSDQSIVVDAANAMATSGDMCRIDSLFIKDSNKTYTVTANFQLESARISSVITSYSFDLE